jgi:hypothetical protein
VKLLSKIYRSKYFPRLFYTKPDGGKDSGVTGYFLIEWKCLFSVGVLRFNEGSREAYHSHAFNALTWWLSGEANELRKEGEELLVTKYKRRWKPKFTPKDNIHKVVCTTKSWCFTLRGSWEDTWKEYRDGEVVTLTHGRKEVWEDKV